jgi:hypothetical protein
MDIAFDLRHRVSQRHRIRLGGLKDVECQSFGRFQTDTGQFGKLINQFIQAFGIGGIHKLVHFLVVRDIIIRSDLNFLYLYRRCLQTL